MIPSILDHQLPNGVRDCHVREPQLSVTECGTYGLSTHIFQRKMIHIPLRIAG